MAEHEAIPKLSVLSLKLPGQLYLDPVTDRAANVRTWEGKFICSVVLERSHKDYMDYVHIDTRELKSSGGGGSFDFSYPLDAGHGAHTVTRCEPEDLARTILTMRVRGEL